MRSLPLASSFAALCAVMALAAPAQALPSPSTLTFNLTCGINDTACLGSISYGSITLTNGADGKSVNVVETLLGGNVFAGTGAGDALAFNVSKAVTLTNILPSGTFIQDLSPKGVPFGTFGYAIDYTGNGTKPPTFTSFSFSTADNTTLTVQDFIANTAGFYFASDIGVADARGNIINTGNVASKGPTTPNVPEPASVAVLGAGLLGLAFTARRRYGGSAAA